MKRTFLLSALALAFGSVAFAQPMPLPTPPDAPVIVVPKPEPAKWLELKGEFPLTRLSAVGDKRAKWELVDTADAELEACESGKKASLVVRREGRYRLLLTGEAGTTRIAVTVGKPVPPTPDVPPTPPGPPLPPDPLVARLQALYTADVGSTKVDQLADLIELYAQAVKLAGDPAVTSAAAIAERVKLAAVKLEILGLSELRKAISAEVGAVMPADRSAMLTAEVRERMAAVFLRIRDALAKVK